jgi:hypothetical protein
VKLGRRVDGGSAGAQVCGEIRRTITIEHLRGIAAHMLSMGYARLSIITRKAPEIQGL